MDMAHFANVGLGTAALLLQTLLFLASVALAWWFHRSTATAMAAAAAEGVRQWHQRELEQERKERERLFRLRYQQQQQQFPSQNSLLSRKSLEESWDLHAARLYRIRDELKAHLAGQTPPPNSAHDSGDDDEGDKRREEQLWQARSNRHHGLMNDHYTEVYESRGSSQSADSSTEKFPLHSWRTDFKRDDE